MDRAGDPKSKSSLPRGYKVLKLWVASMRACLDALSGGGSSLFMMLSELPRSLRIFVLEPWRFMLIASKLSPLSGAVQRGRLK